MNESPLIHLCQHFKLLKLHITVQFERDTRLPAFKGSLLHGWLGHALQMTDPHAYHVFYGEHANQQPKPYALFPNDDHKTEWRKGELYRFEITLFGEATGLSQQVLDALILGRTHGWGANRVPIKLISVSSQTPYGRRAGIHTTYLSDYLPDITGEHVTETAIEFITPVRVKYHGQLLHTLVNDSPFWLNHILRRLKQLTTFWVCDDPELINALYQAAQVSSDWQVQSSSYFEDWQRYSSKHNKLLPFGGVKGQLQFSGHVNSLAPWLAIGEQLHIGGKSTFGLGKYQLILPN